LLLTRTLLTAINNLTAKIFDNLLRGERLAILADNLILYLLLFG
jgi:hypothetical protein